MSTVVDVFIVLKLHVYKLHQDLHSDGLAVFFSSLLSAVDTLGSMLHRALVSLPSLTLLFGVTGSLLHVADTLIDLGKTR